MLKRWLFFLSYILFFTAAPVCVYYFWPADTSEIKSMLDPGADSMDATGNDIMIDDAPVDSTNPYALSDQHWSDSVRRSDSIQMVKNGVTFIDAQEMTRSVEDSLEHVYRMANCSWAVIFCFGLSLLFALGISIYKFCNPGKKLGGLIAGISVYNFLYLPGVISFIFLKFSVYAFYVIFGFAGMLPGRLRFFVFGMVLLVYLFTIILGVLGVVKGIKTGKIISATPQNPPPSAHPRS